MIVTVDNNNCFIKTILRLSSPKYLETKSTLVRIDYRILAIHSISTLAPKANPLPAKVLLAGL